MKKSALFISFGLLVFAFSGCKKEDVTSGEIQSVSSVYKAVVFEQTATWCGPCGESGYPAMHALLDKYKYQTSAIIMHSDDAISSIPIAGESDITNHIGGSGIPSGAVNMGTDTYPTELEPLVKQATIANPVAKAGIGIKRSVSGNTITIDTKTVFFEDLTGTYNLAIYVTENKIMEEQNGQTAPKVEHNHTLRAIAGGKGYGSSIGSNPTKGTKIDGNYTVVIPELRNADNLQVVAVLYKMGTNNKPVAVINSNTF